MEEYNPFKKTALFRSTPSKPLLTLLGKGLIAGKIIDYGCGWGKDYTYLQDLGYDVSAYDKFNPNFTSVKALDNKYDTVLCTYVMNVIKSKQEHMEVAELLRHIGRDTYITLRNDRRAIKSTWQYDCDNGCYRTPKGSYQRYYNECDMELWFGKFEYIVKNSSMIIIKLVK